MPYWAQPWPGSVLLAEAVLCGPEGQGRPAIEIGCGIGIVSIAAATKGWSVTATDYDEDAVCFAEHNAALNGVKLAGCRSLDYRIPLAAPAYELILGSDLLYERKKCEPVARWLASALLPNGQAWLSDPNRSAAEGFENLARQAGLDPLLELAESKAPSGLLTRGRIWRITRRTSI
jgi:ETFB lysine methyltransferase